MNTYVICIKNEGFEASLEKRKLYRVLCDQTASEHNQIRIIDESGDDYLYPTSFFVDIELPDGIQERIENAA